MKLRRPVAVWQEASLAEMLDVSTWWLGVVNQRVEGRVAATMIYLGPIEFVIQWYPIDSWGRVVFTDEESSA